MSPALLYMGAVKNVININLIFFAGLFVLAIPFGRLFCGWICPGSGLTDICHAVNKKKINRKNYWIKYLIWFPWIISIAIFFFLAKEPLSVDVMYGMKTGISILEEGGFIIYFSFVATIILLSLWVGKHSFCHHVCWMAPFMILGTKVGRFLRIPRLELMFNESACNSCGACVKNCPMSVDIPEKNPSILIVDTDCTLCAACIDSCNKNALTLKITNKKKT
jgi:ferredoxin-type protein NapH